VTVDSSAAEVGRPDAHGVVAVLTSGGVDSSVLVAHLAEGGVEVQPLYVRFGLTWERVEEAHLRRYLAMVRGARPLVTLELPIADVYGSHWSTAASAAPDASSADDAVYLPGRNVLLLAKSSVWCALHGISTIALGTLRGNPFPDATPGFFAALGSLLTTALSSPVEVTTPFAGLAKADVLALGRHLQVQHTFSCIAPSRGLHCGRCNKCAERQLAFAELDLQDATRYAWA
jgi:7-cyano-7-deazaguanine synthase